MAPPKPYKKDRHLQLGDYEVHDSGRGFASIRQKSSGEIMHSVNPPEEEARNLYLGPARLLERLSSDQPLILWDVGLGAAHNSMAVIHEFLAANPPGELRILSFENDTDPLKLALKNAPAFPHLHHGAPHELLKHNHWRSADGKLSWELIQGDFAQNFERCPKPHVIFYDPFSFHTNPELWSEEVFLRLHAYCRGEATQLLTYSASTAVRSTLLAAGFYVGYGPSTGPKSSTTVAYNDLPLARRMGTPLLAADWLGRWERSDARLARTLSTSDEADFEARIRRHPQFQP
jgi:queuine tRNA-ribosyltransferase